MNIPLFLALLFGLQIFYWFIGSRSSKKLENNHDYFLAGKNVRFFPLTMTFLATQVGGGLVLGAANEAYYYGPYVLLYPFGVALGLILLGVGLGKRLMSFNVSTVAEILEVSYRSPFLRKIGSGLSILSLFMVLVAQIIASKQFLLSIDFDNSFLFIVFWAVVILYTAQGGLKAVISTDLVQAAFFSIVFVCCFIWIVFSGHRLEMGSYEMTEEVSSQFCGWLFMPLLFMLIEQDMGQRCFAGESSKIVSRATFWAGILTFLICAIPIFLGVLAKSLQMDVPMGSSVLMGVIEKTTHPWMVSFVGCAVLAAIISTATSLINAIGSNITSDFQLLFSRLKNPVRVSQILTAFICILAIYCSYLSDQIVEVMLQSYELSVSCLFVPIFIAMYRRNGRSLSAGLSIFCGAFCFFCFRVVPLSFSREILSILGSFAGFGIGEIFSMIQSKRLAQKNFINFF